MVGGKREGRSPRSQDRVRCLRSLGSRVWVEGFEFGLRFLGMLFRVLGFES